MYRTGASRTQSGDADVAGGWLTSLTLLRHRACGEHSNIQDTPSGMRSSTPRGIRTTKIGCRWHALSDIFSRSRSHRSSLHSRRTGDFILPPRRAITTATDIVQSPSFGVGPTESFTLPSVASLMGGWTTGHQSRFAMSRHFPGLSSHSFSGYWHHRQKLTSMTANMGFSGRWRALSVHREPPGSPTARFRRR